MIETNQEVPGTRRSGIVLLVVMAMLALFATVALSFVFYAEAESAISRYAAQAETQAQADANPEMLLSYFLSQFIYDTENPYSAMRGHSLARTMYGSNPADYNVVPFNGMGRMRFPITNLSLPNVPPGANTKNNLILINNTDFSQTDPGVPTRYPETGQPAPGSAVPGPYVGGNANYTYPDLNNMFLAAVNGNGEVLIPSFHRPWLGVAPTNSSDPLGAWAKYMCLRPHVSYHPQFVTPDWDGGGDVKNMEWGPGMRNGAGTGYFNNDSIWMDLGFGVLTAPNGKRYKPLFAPLIVDLDSKLNLFVHGNIANPGPISALVAGPSHFSHQGWGTWEVNLSKLLAPPQGTANTAWTTEWRKLFQGAIGRYGPNVYTSATTPGSQPDNAGVYPLNPSVPPGILPAPPPAPPRYSSQIDYGQSPGMPFFYPGDTANTAAANPPGTNYPGLNPAGTYPDTNYPKNLIQAFPGFPKSWDNATAIELTVNNPAVSIHPSGYNPLVGGTSNRIALVMAQLEALYRFQGTGSPSMTSDVFANLPLNFNSATSPAQSARIRWLSTLRSMDMDRPSLLPYNSQAFTTPINYAIGASLPYPTVAIPSPAPSFLAPNPSSTPLKGFDPSWRSSVSNSASAGRNKIRARLNRRLPAYPVPDPTTGVVKPADAPAAATALTARTNMAQDIYQLLLQLTNATAQSAKRWLAQLALNIVDFIDDDDIMTAWAWDPNNANDILFGTELPRLVVNEVFAQIDNNYSDPGFTVMPLTNKATNYNVNFWVELHNPSPLVGQAPANGAPPSPNAVYLKNGSQVVYQIVVAVDPLTSFDNNTGKILPAPSSQTLNTWPVGSYVDAAYQNSGFSSTSRPHAGFLVVGPAPPKQNGTGTGYSFNPAAGGLAFSASYDDASPSAQMLFPALSMPINVTALPQGNLNQWPQNKTYGVFLQRLANPILPPNATTNPYVTVDYFKDIKTGNGLYASVKYAPAAGDPNGVTSNPPPIASWRTIGRKQPYVASVTKLQNPNPAKVNAVQNTFSQHNAVEADLNQFAPNRNSASQTLDSPFFWPVHMDRQLVNPLELLNVSCYHPWEYTQKFGAAAGDHRAPWDDQNALIYRLLDSVETPPWPAPAAPGGRVPGKININTIWDKEILDAILDNPNMTVGALGSAADNAFQTLYQNFMKSRTPSYFAGGVPGATDDVDVVGDLGRAFTNPPNPLDTPFKSLGVGLFPNLAINPVNPNAAPSPAPAANAQFPNGLGLQNTILRWYNLGNSTTPSIPLFQQIDTKTKYPLTSSTPTPKAPPAGSTGSFPFKTNEVLTKIYNSTTTRSNVFAVWLTVGFFEVTDESAYPVKLGPEIGRSENRHIRHRMFAIVDRTNIAMPEPTQYNDVNNYNFARITTLGTLSIPNLAYLQLVNTATANVTQTITLNQTAWNLTSTIPGQMNVNFRIRPGMKLYVDTGTNNPLQETVTVKAVDYNTNQVTLTQVFSKTHGAGTKVAPVLKLPSTPTTAGPAGVEPPAPGIAAPGLAIKSIFGNPGPQEGSFDPRQNTLVVPYFSVIQ